MADNKTTQENELLELGKKLQQFYDSGYINKKQTILFSFYKGMASGIGAFLGGTLIIGLVLWFLSFFNQVPLVGHLVDALHHALHK